MEFRWLNTQYLCCRTETIPNCKLFTLTKLTQQSQWKNFNFRIQVEAENVQAKDNISMISGGFDVTHFTSSPNNLESNHNGKIVFDSSFLSQSHTNKNCFKDFNIIQLRHLLHQLWVLTKWQALVSFRNYVKLILHLLLPTLCVLFYGLSVGNDMTEVNLGFGKWIVGYIIDTFSK